MMTGFPIPSKSFIKQQRQVVVVLFPGTKSRRQRRRNAVPVGADDDSTLVTCGLWYLFRHTEQTHFPEGKARNLRQTAWMHLLHWIPCGMDCMVRLRRSSPCERTLVLYWTAVVCACEFRVLLLFGHSHQINGIVCRSIRLMKISLATALRCGLM